MSKRKIYKARAKVQAAITAATNQDDMYSRGLSGEGYKGGYRDALDDIILLLNKVTPQRHGWWEKD